MIIRNSLFITGKEVWLRFTVNEVRGVCVSVTEVELTPHRERRSSIRRPVLSTPKTQPKTVAGAAPQHASQSHSHTGASQRMLTHGAVIVTSCQSRQTMEQTTVSDQI